MTTEPEQTQELAAFWQLGEAELLKTLDSSTVGLTSAESQSRLARRDTVRWRKTSPVRLLLEQFRSPIMLLLIVSAVLSYVLDDATNALIILAILGVSSLLGFWQEWSAADAVAKLLAVIETRTTLLRDGVEIELPVDATVPGDVVRLRAGNVIPGDCRVLESNDLFVDEAALTGESFPAEKRAGAVAADVGHHRRSCALFQGTHVVSGTATAVVVHTGAETEFGKVSARLERRPPETGFERGLKEFGFLLIRVTLVFVVGVFAVNVAFQRPVVDSLLFALALAVGMTPQLLPAITTVVLAAGAQQMARAQVIVKQLLAIENFGSMTVLCCDKTGTLTTGVVTLQAAEDVAGQASERVRRYAAINATLQLGFQNPIDEALKTSGTLDLTGVQKLDEVPYDFNRKRLSVLVNDGGETVLITKGALANLLEVCTSVDLPDGTTDIDDHRKAILARFASLSDQGRRVLGVAIRRLESDRAGRADERDMTFLGFLVLLDPPKPGIQATLGELRRLGVRLKIVTGDNHAVAAAIARDVGISADRLLTGGDVRRLSDDALQHRAMEIDLFAEIEPNQKERIILALKRSGATVGYLGDGINDASALHAADVGISVASAVDVAREAAQIVLLQQDLGVLVEGVKAGRRTFANTLKYVFVALSANFGYMFSMAVVSLFLPFLPLLPAQILLVNLLADFPAMMLATDRVDPELIERPRRWQVRSMARFMLVFGLCGSVFDFLTFGLLLYVYKAPIEQFRTGWFIEAVLTGLVIMLLVRTQRPFWRSRPGLAFSLTLLAVAAVTLLLPYLPFAGALEFVPPPASLTLLVIGISAVYGVGLELAKRAFYRNLAG
ncbi:MAG TPA: magnesium-translocating P-type ATPase [Planctomycetaceae bacterium]|nr:magnesium-translocating P-type ATPase [Planctomycetaceae bacterium]